MNRQIKTAAVIGANGKMGALTGGLIAQHGINTYFFSRDLNKAQIGMQKAMQQARSDTLKKYITCCDYSSIKDHLKECDWIIECVTEDINIKNEIYEIIDKNRKKDSIISTMTSSLPLNELCKNMSSNFKSNFLGVHLFNPPVKLLLCEIAPIPETNPELVTFLTHYLKNRLRREVVPVWTTPGYVGNRIGFVFLSEITKLVPEYGIDLVDYLFGSYTGRAMPPLATLDLVGLDTHKAIIQSLQTYTSDHMHDSLIIPDYMNKLISSKHLGSKTPERGGHYRKNYEQSKSVLDLADFSYQKKSLQTLTFVENIKENIHEGKYLNAFQYLIDAQEKEADIVRQMLCLYISYSFSCIGTVIDERLGISAIDTVMAHGFNWAPITTLIKLFGGKESTMELIKHYKLPVSEHLQQLNDSPPFHPREGKYFIAR